MEYKKQINLDKSITITKNFVNLFPSFYLETAVASCFTKIGVVLITIKSLKCA